MEQVKMAKKAKGGKSAAVDAVAVPEVVAPVAEVAAPEVAAPVAKLTKRNSTPTNAVLVQTDKAPRDRTDHTKAAWEVVSKALPATATELVAALEAAKFDDHTKAKLVSFAAYLSYMIRRGMLAPKQD